MLKLLRYICIQIIVIWVVFGTNLFSFSGFEEGLLLLPNMQMEDPNNLLFGLDGGDTLPIIENNIIDLTSNPKFIEGVVFLPVDFVKQYFNDEFYYDEVEKVLTYTTVNDVIRMKTEELTYFVNDEPLSLGIPIRELEDGVPYMPLELVKKFSHHNFYYDIELDTLVIEDLSKEALYGRVSPAASDYGIIRTWKDRKSMVVKKVASGEEVKIYGDEGYWLKVRTSEGLSGYIKKDDIGDVLTVPGTIADREIYDYSTQMTFEGGLNLAWHQVYSAKGNTSLDDRLEGVHGLDVISPTWFHLNSADGDLTNYADLNYVHKAHAQGIQVWALFSNDFDPELTHEVLSSTSNREKVIKELLALSALYELDGINIDFENVATADGEYFVQFVKELTPYLKKQGLVVSVDMYVPRAWTAHYGRAEVGAVVDYIMVMAYDEHWGSSPDSGSVASYWFAEDGIIKTLDEVESSKVVLGLPYFTRVWYEEVVDGVVDVSSKAYGMDSAYKFMTEGGAEFEWIDEDIKQYYGEFSDDEITYKMWLEEERSIEEKVQLLDEYDLAGVAGWSIIFPKDAIWDVLEDYLK